MTEQRCIRYGDTVIPYRVCRLDRGPARVRIHVEPDGEVVVEAPSSASDATVAAVVQRRSAWICRYRTAIAQRKASLPVRTWVSGESHRYLGRRYMLKVRVDPAAPERVVMSGGQLRVCVARFTPERVRELVHRWYQDRASDRLGNRVIELAQQLPWVRKPPPTAIRQMKSRWGSCSPAGRLTLNSLLIRAPREAVDYVIVHELCHLRHHNHSRYFYALLRRYIPDWQVVKSRLDTMADSLYAECG